MLREAHRQFFKRTRRGHFKQIARSLLPGSTLGPIDLGCKQPLHQLVGVGLRRTVAIQQALEDRVGLDPFKLHARFDAFTWKPIIATSTAKKQGAQQNTDDDTDAVAQETLTKIHDSKVRQAIGEPFGVVILSHHDSDPCIDLSVRP